MALQAKILELRNHFQLSGELTPVISAMLQRTAESDLQLQRYEVLCAQIPLGDPQFEYLKTELNRADKVFRLRFSALQKLISRNASHQRCDAYGVASIFGCYKVKDGKIVDWHEDGGEKVIHWRYVKAHPDRYGFLPRLPRKGVKRIGREIFITEDADEQLRDSWEAEREEKFCYNHRVYGRTLKNEYSELIRKKSADYEYLRPSTFDAKQHTQKIDRPEFNDALPQPADAKTIKSIRNRLDYLRRKSARAKS